MFEALDIHKQLQNISNAIQCVCFLSYLSHWRYHANLWNIADADTKVFRTVFEALEVP